jgi:hypothetical protein
MIIRNKIILWGYPLGSHTYSYIHEAFFKAFSYLGYETYWFHDNYYPKDFKWNDSLFITEGFADNNIPLNSTCRYVVHGVKNPKKYIDIKPKSFIDLRYNHVWMKDHIYDYTLDKSNVEQVGKSCYFQAKENKTIVFKNDYYDYEVEDYDKFYITWATNKLPHEIDCENIDHPRDKMVYFSGNISPNGRCENYSVFKPFIESCTENGVLFVHNDPFINPLSEQEVVLRTKRSLISVDLRGPEHLRNGYVPCRVFKSISAGRLGITNSPEVYKELEGHCFLETNPKEILKASQEKEKDKKFVVEAMKYVKSHHTYINRIMSIFGVL